MPHRIKLIVFICAALVHSGIMGQVESHPLLENFTLSQRENKIYINFSIKGGASCQGVQLERSMDNEEFEQIDQIIGVCGGSKFVEHFQLVDEEPIEYSQNYYRLVLGQQGASQSSSIIFVPLEDNYRVFPSPARSWTVIKFENSAARQFQCKIYNLNGTLIQSIDNISSSEIFLNLGTYSNGVYIFQLLGDESARITGTFHVIN